MNRLLISLAAGLSLTLLAAAQQYESNRLCPNPYNRTTIIKYFVPQSAGTAIIKVFNASGQAVGDYPLSGTGEGELTLQAGQFAAGTYVYKLFVDDVSVDTKKLVIVR